MKRRDFLRNMVATIAAFFLPTPKSMAGTAPKKGVRARVVIDGERVIVSNESTEIACIQFHVDGFWLYDAGSDRHYEVRKITCDHCAGEYLRMTVPRHLFIHSCDGSLEKSVVYFH